MTCSVKGCGRRSRSRGMCPKHYMRWLRHGDPAIVKPWGGQPGNKNGRRRGDDVGYAAVHYRLYAERGPAREHTCACGKPAVHWAFDEPTGFSTDLSRYTPMCDACHKRADQLAERRWSR